MRGTPGDTRKRYVFCPPLDVAVRIMFSVGYVSSVFGSVYNCTYHVIIHSSR